MATNTKRLLTAAVGAAITMAAAGCGTPTTGTQAGGTTTTTSATGQNLAIGKTFHVTNATGNNNITNAAGVDAFVTVESVKYSAESAIGAIGQQPKNGSYAIADVLIQVNAGNYDYSEGRVKYQEPDGTTYDLLSGNAASAGFDPSLGQGSLSAGQKTRGYVTFDVKSRGGLIQLTDILGAVIGQWTVPAT